MSRLPVDPDFEPRIADWFESDPDHAPGAVLDTVLAAFPSIPQRHAVRGPRRFPSMTRFAFLGGVAALVAAVGLGRLIASTPSGLDPSVGVAPSGSATVASPGVRAIPTMTQRFFSVRHPLSIGYPDGWVVTPATTFAGTISQSEGILNAYDAVATDGARFIALSGQPPAGRTPEWWLRGYDSDVAASSCWPAAADRPSVDIGGTTGLLVANGCSSVGPYGRWYRAIATAGDLAYVFQLDTDTLDRSWFEAILRGVEVDLATGRTPGTSPDLGTLEERTSDDVGISIAYPSGWTEVAVPDGAQSIGIQQGVPSEGVVQDVRFDAQWVSLEAGLTADDWIAGRDVPSEGQLDCPPPADASVLIGGHAGRIIDGGCRIPGSRLHFRAVAVVGDRGYTFHMDATKLGEAAFRMLLANVIIDPNAGS